MKPCIQITCHGAWRMTSSHWNCFALLLLWLTFIIEGSWIFQRLVKIPWTEEPGGLQSMGSLRVGRDWATSLSLFTFMHRRRKWQPTLVFLPGESQGWGSLVGCRLWGRTELDTTEHTHISQGINQLILFYFLYLACIFCIKNINIMQIHTHIVWNSAFLASRTFFPYPWQFPFISSSIWSQILMFSRV